MAAGSPLIQVWVHRPDVDVIHLSREEGSNWRAWKSDGFKGDELAAPDQLYEEFELFISMLTDYISDDAKWARADTGEEISAWQAVTILADVSGYFPRDYKEIGMVLK